MSEDPTKKGVRLAPIYAPKTETVKNCTKWVEDEFKRQPSLDKGGMGNPWTANLTRIWGRGLAKLRPLEYRYDSDIGDRGDGHSVRFDDASAHSYRSSHKKSLVDNSKSVCYALTTCQSSSQPCLKAPSKRRSLSSFQKLMAGGYGISHPALKQNHYTDHSARLAEEQQPFSDSSGMRVRFRFSFPRLFS